MSSCRQCTAESTSIQQVCTNMYATCVQDVCNMCARCMQHVCTRIYSIIYHLCIWLYYCVVCTTFSIQMNISTYILYTRVTGWALPQVVIKVNRIYIIKWCIITYLPPRWHDSTHSILVQLVQFLPVCEVTKYASSPHIHHSDRLLTSKCWSCNQLCHSEPRIWQWFKLVGIEGAVHTGAGHGR